MAGMAAQWKEWQNSRMAEMATYVLFMVHTNDSINNRMAESRNGGMVIEWWNGGMAEWRNGGMAGMAAQRKEWLNSRMAEIATYVLFMVHTDDDTDDDDDDTF